ncbi:hypothetical protein HJ590_04540 [Naumannella sp. ID2617S]|uniref:Uncharacterized protein n=1 Tax=Enemella dayhoffiae TaxID=2016507 RepID=A0A255GX03_9ACTN|nr:hypothetical protein [Enemella dayhoffiae]NNG18848.1 hypothetical protein [Naumannella sp. ID2617S]OYO19393.1 hypothetical protein CGZ93_13625 [Enemella dayhoffiae]
MGFLDWVRGVNEKLEPQGNQSTTPVVPSENDILNALDRTEELAGQSGLNPVVLARVRRVAGGVRETLPRMKNVGMGSSETYAVMATATDYLPEALSAYLRLPRDWADSRPVENGKTSLMLLIDQLDLLGTTVDKIFDAVCRSDADALIVHGRFLTARFGGESTGGELDLAAGADTSGPAPQAGAQGPAPLAAPSQPPPPAAPPTQPANPLDLP